MPSDLSMKNTVPSGGFAADRFFDRTGLQIEVLREILDGIAGLVSLVDGRNGYAGTRDYRSAKRNCRVHDYDPRIGLGRRIRFGVAGEWIELDRKALRVSLDPLEVDAYNLLHRLLPLARSIDQISVALDEKVQTIGLKRHRPQKTWRTAWRSLTKAAGLRGLRFHDLRHQAITELAEAGASDATMMALAGHMSREMLEHYSHVRMEAKRTALDKLESGLMGLTRQESIARQQLKSVN